MAGWLWSRSLLQDAVGAFPEELDRGVTGDLVECEEALWVRDSPDDLGGGLGYIRRDLLLTALIEIPQ
ncbi:hypothetical protein [Gordonia paraffinivorans]|uniref:hypothetical protein n=1 Tax=Gordonia paraffinivorans TaxID=175628 RepID=UPI001446C5A5|nr:hypothetical protein [Gordonia paraffinivorans]